MKFVQKLPAASKGISGKKIGDAPESVSEGTFKGLTKDLP